MKKPKRPQRHIIVKLQMLTNRENLKSSKGETVIYKGAPKRLSDDFSRETLQARGTGM